MSEVEHAIAEIAAGHTIIVVDDADREDNAHLIAAAAAITPEAVAFMATHGHGLIYALIAAEDASRLNLPPMVTRKANGTAFTVSVDAADGISTGRSAADLAHTLRLLTNPTTRPEHLNWPGQVFPLVAHPDGVLGRVGHTEARFDLAQLAGCRPAAVIRDMRTPDALACRGTQLRAFAAAHEMALITVAQLVAYRREHELTTVRRQAEARLPTAAATFQAIVYYDRATGIEHVALCLGLDTSGRFRTGQDVLVRVHSECLTGEAFGSLRCDCGPQLDDALAAIAAEGCGAVVYLRGHEGRGAGLTAKIRAYALQEQGRDTVEANLDQGLPADARDYAAAAQILLDLGAEQVRLKSNNPAKADALAHHGVTVRGLVAAPAPVAADNRAYLHTKAERMGHVLPWLPPIDQHIAAPELGPQERSRV